MAVKRKKVNIGVDLDGVVAKHSLAGFWVLLRRLKESLLLGSDTHYYYPSTIYERIAWCQINKRRLPFTYDRRVIKKITNSKSIKLYLVTSRFKFLEDLTHEWLERHGLEDLFSKIQINTGDEDPFVYKENAIFEYNLDSFIDDDIEVIRYLKQHTKAKLYWVVPKHKKQSDNDDSSVTCVNSFQHALEEIGVV